MKPEERQKRFVADVRSCDALIYRVCRLYGNRHDESVDDIYQEIVCALWESYDTFHGESNFSTWAYSVARNTAVAYYRRHILRQPTLDFTDLELSFKELTETTDPLVDELYHLLDHLGATDRLLVGLYLDGYNYVEIGKKMHLNEQAVRTRFCRIKARLKEIKDTLK